MKLTTRGHYGVKALLDMTLQSQKKPISVKAIALRQGIPAPYLEKLLIELRRAKIVKSIRGAHGGYKLARHPSLIRLGDVLEALGEVISPMSANWINIEQAEDWVTISLWQRLHSKLIVALYNITLADLYYDARSWQAAQQDGHNFVV